MKTRKQYTREQLVILKAASQLKVLKSAALAKKQMIKVEEAAYLAAEMEKYSAEKDSIRRMADTIQKQAILNKIVVTRYDAELQAKLSLRLTHHA